MWASMHPPHHVRSSAFAATECNASWRSTRMQAARARALAAACRGAVGARTSAGVPMVCLPIWHWYMLRGDWLKSENGVSEATTLSMAAGCASACVNAAAAGPSVGRPSGHLRAARLSRTRLQLTPRGPRAFRRRRSAHGERHAAPRSAQRTQGLTCHTQEGARRCGCKAHGFGRCVRAHA